MPDAQLIASLDIQLEVAQRALVQAKAELARWKREVKQIEHDINRIKRQKKDELKRKS